MMDGLLIRWIFSGFFLPISECMMLQGVHIYGIEFSWTWGYNGEFNIKKGRRWKVIN
jgi:hypothetical protein